jgi:hypothetical protein
MKVYGEWFDADMIARAKRNKIDLKDLRRGLIKSRSTMGGEYSSRGYYYVVPNGYREYTWSKSTPPEPVYTYSDGAILFTRRRDGKVQSTGYASPMSVVVESEPFIAFSQAAKNPRKKKPTKEENFLVWSDGIAMADVINDASADGGHKFKTGTPFVARVFHGSPNSFTAFDNGKLGENTGAGSAKMGHFAAGNRGTSESYAESMNGDSEFDAEESLDGDIEWDDGSPTLKFTSDGGKWLRHADHDPDALKTDFPDANFTDADVEALRAYQEYLEDAIEWENRGWGGESPMGMSATKRDINEEDILAELAKNGLIAQTYSAGVSYGEWQDTDHFTIQKEDDGTWTVSRSGTLISIEKSRGAAEMAANEELEKQVDMRANNGEGSMMLRLFLRSKNPYVYDYKGKPYREISYAKAITTAKKKGHDAVVLMNTFDGGPKDNIFVFFDPNQVKSVDNKGTYSRADNDINFSQAESVEDDGPSLNSKRVSPRLPTAVKATEDSFSDPRLQPDLATFKRDRASFEHNIGLMAQYPNFTGVTGTTDEQAEKMLDHMVSNLLYLHDSWKPTFRDRSRLWYVGGNRITHRWAKRFGVQPEQVAGVIAATSPQKDWFQNVSLAERVLEAMVNNSNVAWDQSMTDLARSRDWGKKEIPNPSVYEGKTLRQLYGDGTPGALRDMAIWIRAWDEAKNPQVARVISPEGAFSADYDKGKTGKPVALRWQSFPTIVKTLQILMANSVREISTDIGANHKVRSFYNNIIAPYGGGDVTIDTHAVAAALLRPLGSSSTEVNHNFGGGDLGSVGPKNSAITGLNGTYALYAEAYRRAADQRNLLPREMQSIAWEAVRGLFRPEQKNEKIKAESDRIWSGVAAGERDAKDARAEIEKLVQGIVDPAWSRSDPGTNEAREDSSYERELHRPGVLGRGAEAVPGRDGVPAAQAVPVLSQVANPYARFDGVQVRIPILIEDTGQTAHLRMDAGKALRSLDERMDTFRRTLECLSR